MANVTKSQMGHAVQYVESAPDEQATDAGEWNEAPVDEPKHVIETFFRGNEGKMFSFIKGERDRISLGLDPAQSARLPARTESDDSSSLPASKA